jgi:TPP-dependent pyruvate/acetoin dehydrogenase alpha subunit
MWMWECCRVLRCSGRAQLERIQKVQGVVKVQLVWEAAGQEAAGLAAGSAMEAMQSVVVGRAVLRQPGWCIACGWCPCRRLELPHLVVVVEVVVEVLLREPLKP